MTRSFARLVQNCAQWILVLFTPCASAFDRDPLLLSHVPLTALTAQSVAIADSSALVCEFLSLHIIDIADPNRPVSLSTFETADPVYAVVVTNGNAFVANGSRGLRILDIRDPANPRPVAIFDTPGTASDLALAGNYILIADGSDGLQILDISNPSFPVRAGFLDTPGRAVGVATDGVYAYVADGPGVQIINISDRSRPTNIVTFAAPARQVTLHGQHLYISRNGFTICDVSIPSQPKYVSRVTVHRDTGNVSVANGVAALAYGDEGVQLFDIATPSNPRRIGVCPTLFAMQVQLVCDIAFVADNRAGLKVFRINKPANVQHASVWATPGPASGLTFVSPHVYVANGYLGLAILDPAEQPPKIIAEYASTGFVYSVTIASNVAFLGKPAEFELVDVSDPASPKRLASMALDGVGRAFAFNGATLFVAAYEGGLQIFDTSNLKEPRHVAGIPTSHFTHHVTFHQDRVFLADGIGGMQIIDVSVRAEPKRIGHYVSTKSINPGYVFTNSIYGVNVIGSYAFLSGSHGLEVVDVRDPSNLRPVAEFAASAAYKIDLVGELAYLSTASGLEVLDLTDPTYPRRLGGKLRITGIRFGHVRQRCFRRQLGCCSRASPISTIEP